MTISYGHEYMKWDRRHIFTIAWNSAMNPRSLQRYFWVAISVFAETVVFRSLRGFMCTTETLVFAACIAATTIPSPLTEPRYYIIPAAFVLRQLNDIQVAKTFTAFLLVDIALLILFTIPPHPIW